MAWISPTGYEAGSWTYEERAYDGEVGAGHYAYQNGTGWSDYLTLTLTSTVRTNKVRFYAECQYSGKQIDIDVYDPILDLWVGMYQGSFTNLQWTEKTLNLRVISKVRIRLYHGQSGYRCLHELEVWEVEASVPGYSNCLALWRMNDNAASTTVKDSSGNGNDGTAWTNTDQISVTGKIDGALCFDGSPSQINCGDVCDVGTGDFSIVMWFKTPINNARMVNKQGTDPMYHFMMALPGKLRAKARDADSDEAYRVTYQAVNDDSWHLAIVTFDRDVSDGVHIYIDASLNEGSMYGNLANVGDLDNANDLKIGADVLEGEIDVTMIFNKVLSSEEIIWLWNGGNGRENLTSARPLVGGSLASGRKGLV